MEETEHGHYRIRGENTNGARLEGTFVMQHNMQVIKTGVLFAPLFMVNVLLSLDLRFEGVEQPFQVVLESDMQHSTASKWKLLIVKVREHFLNLHLYSYIVDA